MILDLTFYIILFTGTLCVYSGLANLILLKRNINNWLLSALYFCLGVMQIYHYLMLTGALIQYPHFALIHAPFVYYLGPLLHLILKFLTRLEYQFKRKDVLHLLPGIGVVLLLVPFYIQDASFKLNYLKSPPNILNVKGIESIYPFILYWMALCLFLYVFFFLRNNTFIWKIKHIKKNRIVYFSHLIIISICSAVVLIIVCFILVNTYEFNRDFYQILIAVFSYFTAFGILFFHSILIRYPEFFKKYQIEYQSISGVSHIKNIDLEGIAIKLKSLMENEKLFCDEDLNLSKLSMQLSITQHQLSQILNETYNKNFNTFINEYRVEEAKRMIIHDVDRSITSIALSVGFSNVSVFYKWFRKITGNPPGSFREKV